MWKDTKEYIKAMPTWKKLLWFAAVAAGTLLLLSFLIWAFSQHGTMGLFEVNGVFRIAFIVLMFCTIALPLLAVMDVYIASRKTKGKIRLPSTYIWIIAIITILISSLLMGWLIPQSSQRVGDKAVQLMMADVAGKNGIPDLAVTFWTINPTQNMLKWGKDDSSYVEKEDNVSQQHAFMLRDLQPSTRYWYSLNDSVPVHFTTMPGKGQPLHFAVGSDAHFGAGTARNDLTGKMLRQIADPEHNYRMFFFLGDLVEHGFNDAQWEKAIQAFSSTTSKLPTRIVVGNHDTLFGGVNLYEEYMSPQPMEIQTGSRLWQRIDVDDVHFLLLDLEWGIDSYTPEQEAWLEGQLLTIPADDWCIVMSHCYYYSSGGVWDMWHWYDDKGMIEKLVPLFEKYDVDLVFSGHNHLLELLQKNNVTYVICGAFGGLPDPERSYVSPASVWYKGNQQAFVDTTIAQDAATLVFRDPEHNEVKSFTISR
ncbi:MAG: metallophosphoesterase [Dehalococcoidia bacterium]|nr:metallophosphoesterase [Dehalococcoidia bacterium]